MSGDYTAPVVAGIMAAFGIVIFLHVLYVIAVSGVIPWAETMASLTFTTGGILLEDADEEWGL